jgi:hypothetical protein
MIGTSSWILRCTRRFSRNSNVLISSSLIGATTSASSSWGMTCLQAKSQPILGGVRTKMSERALRRKKLRKMKTGTENVPLLKDTMRKLYMRTHPDLFGQYPTQQQINEESYKELLGILDSIEKNNEFPSAKKLQLPFYLKTPVEGQFKKVSLNLRTTGGACNTLVEAALGTFFTECGLPAVFRWQEGSWGKTLGKEAVQNENLKFDKEKPVTKTFEEEENKPEHIAPAYHPVDRNAPQDHSIERILTELNDVS